MTCEMQDTSRPIVKNHHSVVLRAESAAEKYSWLTRLLAASGNPQGPRGAASKPQQGAKPPSPEQPKVRRICLVAGMTTLLLDLFCLQASSGKPHMLQGLACIRTMLACLYKP